MSVIATFYLETPILRTALERVPEMAVSIEQQTVTDTTPLTLMFWASGGDFEAFEAGLADDPTVTDSGVLASIDGTRLYRVQLTEYGEEVITYQQWAELDAVFLSSERSGDGWRIRMRFPDREGLHRYAEFCAEHDLTFELQSVYPAEGEREDTYGLTDVQRETLLAAVEAGYFAIPRETSTEELADRLGVSSQAVSERLRRGTETLIRATLVDPANGSRPEEDEPS